MKVQPTEYRGREMTQADLVPGMTFVYADEPRGGKCNLVLDNGRYKGVEYLGKEHDGREKGDLICLVTPDFIGRDDMEYTRRAIGRMEPDDMFDFFGLKARVVEHRDDGRTELNVIGHDVPSLVGSELKVPIETPILVESVDDLEVGLMYEDEEGPFLFGGFNRHCGGAEFIRRPRTNHAIDHTLGEVRRQQRVERVMWSRIDKITNSDINRWYVP